MTPSGQSVMDTVERSRHRICHTVTDEQAWALRALRLTRGEPELMFSRERWSDGVRMVVTADNEPVLLLDVAGEVVPWGI